MQKGQSKMMMFGFGRQLVGVLGLRLLGRIAGMVALATAVGCATVGTGIAPDASPEAMRDAVRERSEARWQVLLKRDYAAAYEFFSPGSRQQLSLSAFEAKMKGVDFRGVKVEAVECEGETCKVRISITYDHRLMKGVVTPAGETWIIEKGQAWYVWQQ
jgi:hypothetical protein